ncbi:MAG: protein translocase subunit SecD [Pseudomonadota bacterium]
MNQYPLWRYFLVIGVLTVGVLYALPNVFGTDPALQLSSNRGLAIDDALEATINNTLDEAGIGTKSVTLESERLLMRFNTVEDREAAKRVLENDLDPTQFTLALNLAPATPPWLADIGGKPMYMGLDLRGGVHFLMEVDMNNVRKQAAERFSSELRSAFREEKLRYRSIGATPEDQIRVEFLNPQALEEARQLVGVQFEDLFEPAALDTTASATVFAIKEESMEETRKLALSQNLTTLRNRVNALGVAEPVIQQQGRNRIIVQLPGVEDTAAAKLIIGATATLEFRMVDVEGDVSAALETGRPPVNSKLYYERDGGPVLLRKTVMLTGDSIINARQTFDTRDGGAIVQITLDGKGARQFSRATREEVGKPMAVVYIEQRQGRRVEEVINIATIRSELGKQFQIEGLDSPQEARTLALLLRAGALAAPIEIVEERTVGPNLGKENIDRGFDSVVIGFVAVLIFMAFYYRVFGLVADVALATNLVLIVAVLSMLQATLTLPGIAGIVLTVGMAVDANVLIFQRIREELKNGNSPQASIQSGYDKAFSTIADANVTTLIAAIVLMNFGTGPIKGFAVTLSIGIATSMFTAIIGTRAIINLIYGGRRVDKLAI